MAEDPHQHQRNRLVEVQRTRRTGQDGVRIPQVGVEVVRDSVRSADQQRAGVDQYQGVVVNIDDPGVRSDPLGDLMGVVGRG